jgi:3alpha(or 20beta)-hydroxysteroid dehydrogenase
MDGFDLAGKTALVVGGAADLRVSQAEALAKHGAAVIIASMDAAAGATAGQVALDAASEASWSAALPCLPGIDILVSNAAAGAGAIAETGLADLRAALSANLEGAYLALRHAPALFGEGGGSIINVVSTSGLAGRVGEIGGAVGGWALRGLARSAARELADRRIRVNTVIHAPAAAGAPPDIAGAVVFLASDRSGFINGAELLCDGGATAGMG